MFFFLTLFPLLFQGLFVFVLLRIAMVQSQNQLPFVSDSLAHDQSALNTAQVPLRLAIEGNPQFYVPGKMYKGEQNISVSLKDCVLQGL